ncbi:MAG: hypothetical protein QOJ74_1894 [Ilumatobacteraceae bacterium]|jgi:hypothetical protein|nr:hypothetical protein [Ilumatobacteraceae bacterium]
MSYQPQSPPTFQQPPPPPFAPAPPVAPAKGKRRKGLILFGLILLIGGILTGGALVAKSMSNLETAVKNLARAPVGCTTTLVFDKPATFTIYIETKGKVGDLGGDCAANGASYQHAGSKLPKVSLTLVSVKSGKELDLQRGTSASYDAAGFVGTGYRTVKIVDPGNYRINVESDESDFAVSIGKNPKDDSDLLKTIGGAVALGGFVLGLMFVLLGLRRRRPADAGVPTGPAGPITAWTPTGYAPTGPPSPPRHPGYRPDPPEPVIPGAVPTQPPVRPPEQPAGGGFAPPSMAPPPPPPPPPPNTGWTVPDDEVLPP